jgi:hypothetical protein
VKKRSHRITIRLTMEEVRGLRDRIGLEFTSLSALVRDAINQYIRLKAVA